MATEQDYASTFSVEELTGLKRRVDLTGWALPFRDNTLSFDSSQRAEVDWLPGNPNGTVQVLGRTLDPSTCSGVWNDKFLKNPLDVGLPKGSYNPPARQDNFPVPDAISLVFLFESILAQGQLVEVTWDQMVRQGILTNFKATPLRHQDWRWSMTFKWISDGTPQGPATVVNQIDTTNLMLEMNNDLQAVSTAATPDDFQVSLDFSKQLNGAVFDLNDAVQSVTSTVGQSVSAALSPLDAAARLSATLGGAVQNAQNGIDATYGHVLADTAQVPDPAAVGTGTCVYYATFKLGVRTSLKAARHTALDARARLQSQNNSPPILATLLAKQGTDLRQISTQYYGTPMQWHQIARFNRLSSSLVAAGTTINIPRLQGGS